MQTHRIVTRILAAAAVATALAAISPLFSPAVSADAVLAYQPNVVEPPATLGFLTPTSPSEEVVLDDFTPPQPRPGRTMVAMNDLLVASPNENGGLGGPNDLIVAGPNANGGLGGPDDLKAGPGCSIQCITSGVAYARGVGAKLVVETDTPAQIWIIVWDDNGYNQIVDSGFGEVTSFGHVFEDLEPGHTYYAMAAAEDSQGYTSHAYGNFVTLNRYVQVSLSSANVTDHVFSPSHFSKGVWANGQWLEQYSADPLDLQGSTLSWGDNVILLSNVDRYLDFAVQLSEWDEDADGICEAVLSPDEPALGPVSCGYRAYAMLHDNDLDDRPANATSWTEHTLHRTLMLPDAGGALPPGYGSPLDFTVDVTLHVIYQ